MRFCYGALTTSFYDLGPSRLGFEPLTSACGKTPLSTAKQLRRSDITSITKDYVTYILMISKPFPGCPEQWLNSENCSIPCPMNCLWGNCHMLKRTCVGCAIGFTGPTCQKSKIIFGWQP